jgi:hypothetical protein
MQSFLKTEGKLPLRMGFVRHLTILFHNFRRQAQRQTPRRDPQVKPKDHAFDTWSRSAATQSVLHHPMVSPGQKEVPSQPIHRANLDHSIYSTLSLTFPIICGDGTSQDGHLL